MLDKNDLQAMQELISNSLSPIDKRLDAMQSDINAMQTDITTLKHTAYIVENDIAPKIQALLENHSDLAKNAMVAKDVDERVGVLEFEVKVIKKQLETLIS